VPEVVGKDVTACQAHGALQFAPVFNGGLTCVATSTKRLQVRYRVATTIGQAHLVIYLKLCAQQGATVVATPPLGSSHETPLVPRELDPQGPLIHNKGVSLRKKGPL